jgi:HEAT repeat protein
LVDWASLTHAYGPATDVPGLLADLRDPERRPRALAELYGTIYHQGRGFSATAAAIPPLLALLDDGVAPAELLRLLTHLVVGDFGVGSAWSDPPDDPALVEIRRRAAVGVPRYAALLTDPDPDVRGAAALALWPHADDPAVSGVLRERFREEPDPAVRADLAFALGGEAPDDPDPRVRLVVAALRLDVPALVDALGGVGDAARIRCFDGKDGVQVVRHRLVLARAREDLHPVESQDPEADEAHLAGDLEHLDEEDLEHAGMLAAESRDGVVVGLLIAREHPERDVLVGRSLDAARREHARDERVSKPCTQQITALARCRSPRELAVAAPCSAGRRHALRPPGRDVVGRASRASQERCGSVRTTTTTITTTTTTSRGPSAARAPGAGGRRRRCSSSRSPLGRPARPQAPCSRCWTEGPRSSPA